MQLHWYIVTASLYTEIGLCGILSLPIIPGSLKKIVANWSLNPVVRNVVKIYVLLVAFLFAETMFELFSSNVPSQKGDSHEEYHHYISERLEDERNGLLSFISLFMFLMIEQLSILTRENNKLITNAEVLQKQAKGISTEYMKLMKEGQEKTKPEKAPDTEKNLEKENKELKIKLEKALNEVTVIKTQAENQQGAYSKLIDENKGLKNKLDDFSLMFGEAQKKSV